MDAIEAKKICDDGSFYEIGKVWKQVFSKTLAKSKMNGAALVLMKELGTKKLAHTILDIRDGVSESPYSAIIRVEDEEKPLQHYDPEELKREDDEVPDSELYRELDEDDGEDDEDDIEYDDDDYDDSEIDTE